MWKLNKVLGWTLIGGTALWIAGLAENETAKAIISSLWDTVSNSTSLILDSLNVPTEVSTFIAENAPLSFSWWESLVWPAMFWGIGAYLWNKSSKILWSWTWTDANKYDDNIAWTAGLIGWLWFGLWSVSLAAGWLTWLSYVASRKVIEKMLPPNYVHLAKYIALAPAWFMASTTWLVDSSIALASTALAWTWLLWYNMSKA